MPTILWRPSQTTPSCWDFVHVDNMGVSWLDSPSHRWERFPEPLEPRCPTLSRRCNRSFDRISLGTVVLLLLHHWAKFFSLNGTPEQGVGGKLGFPSCQANVETMTRCQVHCHLCTHGRFSSRDPCATSLKMPRHHIAIRRTGAHVSWQTGTLGGGGEPYNNNRLCSYSLSYVKREDGQEY